MQISRYIVKIPQAYPFKLLFPPWAYFNGVSSPQGKLQRWPFFISVCSTEHFDNWFMNNCIVENPLLSLHISNFSMMGSRKLTGENSGCRTFYLPTRSGVV